MSSGLPGILPLEPHDCMLAAQLEDEGVGVDVDTVGLEAAGYGDLAGFAGAQHEHS